MMSKTEHIASLNGLRGIAAWLVVISHANNTLGDKRLIFFIEAGQAGVMIFFVLSGFLMGYLYMKQEPSQKAVYRFAVHRVARIVPLYFAVVVASFLLGKLGLGGYVHRYNVNPENLLEHLLFIRGQNLLWTIPVEVSFYVVFVGLWVVYSRSGLGYGLVILGLLTAVTSTDFTPLPTGHELPRYLMFFIAGLGVANIFHSRFLKDRKAMTSSLGLVAVLGGTALLIPGNFRAVFGMPLGGYESTIPVVLASLVLLFACISGAAGKLLETRGLQLQGQISYSVYLLHPIVMYTLRKNTGLEGGSLLALTLPLVFVVGWLSFRYFEKPAQQAVKRALWNIKFPGRHT